MEQDNIDAKPSLRYSCNRVLNGRKFMDPNNVKQMIEAGLSDSTVLIDSNDGVHFNAIVISEQFASKNRIERQKLVYSILGEHITNGTIHAISFKTVTPEEWRLSTTK